MKRYLPKTQTGFKTCYSKKIIIAYTQTSKQKPYLSQNNRIIRLLLLSTKKNTQIQSAFLSPHTAKQAKALVKMERGQGCPQ